MQLPVLVAVGSAQEYNVDREALVQQALLAFDLDQLNQIFLGAVVQLAAAVARVSEGAYRPTWEIVPML